MLSSARFREGLEKIPGATVEKAGEMLDELSTGWSRFSVDLIPALGRAVFSRGFDPNIDYDRAEVEAMRRALESHPAVLLFSHRSYLDGVIVPVAMQEMNRAGPGQIGQHPEDFPEVRDACLPRPDPVVEEITQDVQDRALLGH